MIKEGKGKEFYSKGDRYEGNWKNGKKEGKGVYYYKNCDRYEGDWKDNEIEGKGIFYFNNGSTESREYIKGKKI